MIQLMLEMATFLVVALVLGVTLGYLIWGWSVPRRLLEARRDGAKRAYAATKGAPSPEAEARIAALEQKASLLRAENDGLRRDHKAPDSAPVTAASLPIPPRNRKKRKPPATTRSRRNTRRKRRTA